MSKESFGQAQARFNDVMEKLKICKDADQRIGYLSALRQILREIDDIEARNGD
jgi:hypothetical protein